jgi:putative copper resistance protein D
VSALVVCRFAHFLAAMLTFGASAYVQLFAPGALALELSRAPRRVALVASLVALATAMLWLALESGALANDSSAALDPAAIAVVLTDTSFGRVWTWRLALVAALVAVVVTLPKDRWAASTMVASGAVLASLGLVGHAAMQSGAEGLLHRANHALHLLAAGAWIGGLVPFAMCLNAYRNEELRTDAVRAMCAFSYWGQFVVAAVVLTGGANILLTSGRFPLPPTTSYRALLLVKIALVVVMISLALFNRHVLAPRSRQGARALAALRATSVAEVVLGCVVVALVSAFALLDPA